MEIEGLSAAIGKRVRMFRAAAGLSQEKLAEKAGMHSTYIGQVERGEKNVTIESLSRIIRPLDISLSEFFESFDEGGPGHDTPASRCYEMLACRPIREQEQLQEIVYRVVSFFDSAR